MTGCLPYMGNSYPYNWINRKQYLSELMAGSAEAYAQGATLDEARKRLLPTLQRKYADMGECYPESWPQELNGEHRESKPGGQRHDYVSEYSSSSPGTG
jgi:hypothetical protein